jgi:membrane associated rhomboid family serine protease
VIPLKDNIPTRRFPILTVVIIAINVAVFIGFTGITPSDEKVVDYGAIPYEITHPGKHCDRAAVVNSPLPQETIACEGERGVSGDAPDQPPTWVTIFTSMFMHGGLLHIAGNMLFLWIFGNNVEDSMGRLRFVAFYLLGGIAALLAQTAISPDSAAPTVGASGAIAAVLGGYALLYPRARVITVVFIILFFTILELPALVVLGLWFLLQLFYGAADLAQPVEAGGGVAYFAHIGGFAFGLLLIKLFANRIHHDYDAAHRLPVY